MKWAVPPRLLFTVNIAALPCLSSRSKLALGHFTRSAAAAAAAAAAVFPKDMSLWGSNETAIT